MASVPFRSALPETHKALILTSRSEPLTVQTVPTPPAVSGSATIQVLAATVLSYAGEAYSGKRPYPFVTPIVPGTSAVGRIVAVGPDSTALRPGQLVLVDSLIRSRDEPAHAILHGLVHSPDSVKLMELEWRDGTYAQYTKAPLEACYPLDEARLLAPGADGGLGLTPTRLAAGFQHLVPYGGFDDIALRPGETVIVAPATGPFGGAAVRVALALGARVLAMGRNTEALDALVASSSPAPGRVVAVPLTPDAGADAEALRGAAAGAPIDAFFDISPPMAAGSHHVATCIKALRHGGRVSLMGGVLGEVAVPHREIMRRNLTIKGTWMYTREQALRFVRLLESGVLGLEHVEVVGEFGLGEWEAAFDCARDNARPGQAVVMTPWK